MLFSRVAHQPWPAPLTRRQQAQDLLLAIAASVFAILALVAEIGDGPPPEAGPGAIALVLAGGLSLAGRRRWPVPVLAVVVVCRLLVAWEPGNEVALAPAAAIALYTVARTGARPVRLAIAIAAAVVMMTVVALLEDEPFHGEFLGEGAQMLLPVAVADAVRGRADRLRDRIDAEADARVHAERLRIARDLHDVVAHGLATIAVQSGVAAHLLERDPDQAKDALEAINRTGKQSLEELRNMVGVLRSTDLVSAEDEAVPLRPVPADPDDLSGLIVRAEESGLVVRVDVEGAFPPDVSDGCVIAFHRIVQEALTNVTRHGGKQEAELSVRHGNEEVELRVRNQVGPAPRPMAPTGMGVIGMTERAQAAGGTLTTTLTGASPGARNESGDGELSDSELNDSELNDSELNDSELNGGGATTLFELVAIIPHHGDGHRR